VAIEGSEQAHAVAEYTRGQIIAKTRESVVAQANQQPQAVLSLLK
jgi:flagellin-like hook-associated protein FlgL